MSEGVDKNAGVIVSSTVASPLKSRMGDMGVLEEVIKLRVRTVTEESEIRKKVFNLYIYD
jgi:hypothetical protein